MTASNSRRNGLRPCPGRLDGNKGVARCSLCGAPQLEGNEGDRCHAEYRQLSKRMLVTLQACARKGGSHAANNSNAAYNLTQWGLVTIDTYPWAVATPVGLRTLKVQKKI